MIKRTIFTGLITMSLTACQTMTAAPAQDAVRSSPDPVALTEISAAVFSALGGRKTWLAEDVLTTSPTLIIDPKYVDDRSRQRPNHFRLQLAEDKCGLLHEESGEFYPLRQTSCIPF